MMRPPTERQAALAARQLYYHRERLGWLRDKMQENETLLSLYLTGLQTRAAVLPGGYRILGEHALPYRDGVAVEKLAPAALYEQLALRVGERETAQSGPSETSPTGGEPRGASGGEGPTYAERRCCRCFGGVVHIGGPAEVRTAPCPDCHGTGKVHSYLYPKPKGRRGPWPPEEPAQGRRSKEALAQREGRNHRENGGKS